MTDLATPSWSDLEAPTSRPRGVTASEFRRRVVAKEPVADLCFMKRVATKSLEEGKDRELRVIAGASTVDLERDTVSVKGTDLRFYRTNPIVLPNHDRFQLPIALSVKLGKVGTRKSADDEELHATIRYAPPEVNALADSFYQNHLWRRQQKALGDTGAMFSIYANPVDQTDASYTFNKDRGGIDFKKQVLWEISDVTLGAQQRAQVLEAKAAGVPMEPVLEWALSIVKGDGDLLVLERTEADRIVKTLDPLKGLEVFEIRRTEEPPAAEEPPAWAAGLVTRIEALEKAPKESPEPPPEPVAPATKTPAADELSPEDIDGFADLVLKKVDAELVKLVGAGI